VVTNLEGKVRERKGRGKESLIKREPPIEK